MTTVVLSTSNVADYPEGGGHFWVYMQYVLGLRALGCEVFWLEHFRGSGIEETDIATLRIFLERMKQFDMSDNVLIHEPRNGVPFFDSLVELSHPAETLEKICSRADLLINFLYGIDPDILSRFKRTALIDIDPGLLQFWLSQGQIVMPAHDVHFSTGETAGTPGALFPDCGIFWHRTRPIVSLNEWPMAYHAEAEFFTTVSGWWGGGEEGEWITDRKEICYENNKRVSFMEFVELPLKTEQKLELALCLGEGDTGPEKESITDKIQVANGVTDYVSDAIDRAILEANRWKVRLAPEVAASPFQYRRYIQDSRGEFSCAKPSCMKFQNAWVSDRSLCYLASGKPVIVQNTGPSEFLPDADGMFRFHTIDDILNAIDLVNSDYRNQCMAARDLAATFFDAEKVLSSLLDRAI